MSTGAAAVKQAAEGGARAVANITGETHKDASEEEDLEYDEYIADDREYDLEELEKKPEPSAPKDKGNQGEKQGQGPTGVRMGTEEYRAGLHRDQAQNQYQPSQQSQQQPAGQTVQKETDQANHREFLSGEHELQPGANQPVLNQPVANQPGANQPGANQPDGNQPVPNQPVPNQPVPNQPEHQSPEQSRSESEEMEDEEMARAMPAPGFARLQQEAAAGPDPSAPSARRVPAAGPDPGTHPDPRISAAGPDPGTRPFRGVSPDKVKVIMVAYMRGGSSLLGRLFADNSDALYWFESLSALYGAMVLSPPLNQVADITHDRLGQPR